MQVHDGARLFLCLKPGINPTNTSSLRSCPTNSSGITNGLTSCYPTNNSCCIKTTDTDQNWQSLQGAGIEMNLSISNYTRPPM